METLKIITPGLIAIIGNIIFYWIIKSRIDKSIEKYKTSYAGVFKERIEIYRKLLSMIYELQRKLSVYMYNTEEDVRDIQIKFNDFINFYLINQPFLSTSLIEKIKKIREEYQQCFEDSYIGQIKQKNQITLTEGALQQVKSRNKLMTNYFISMQEQIISEMRRDLQIER